MLALLEQLAVSFDLPILDWIQANLTSPLADEIWPRITLLGDDAHHISRSLRMACKQ